MSRFDRVRLLAPLCERSPDPAQVFDRRFPLIFLTSLPSVSFCSKIFSSVPPSSTRYIVSCQSSSEFARLRPFLVIHWVFERVFYFSSSPEFARVRTSLTEFDQLPLCERSPDPAQVFDRTSPSRFDRTSQVIYSHRILLDFSTFDLLETTLSALRRLRFVFNLFQDVKDQSRGSTSQSRSFHSQASPGC